MSWSPKVTGSHRGPLFVSVKSMAVFITPSHYYMLLPEHPPQATASWHGADFWLTRGHETRLLQVTFFALGTRQHLSGENEDVKAESCFRVRVWSNSSRSPSDSLVDPCGRPERDERAEHVNLPEMNVWGLLVWAAGTVDNQFCYCYLCVFVWRVH